MPNWHESMQQTFEYYVVDPVTWKDMRLLNTVKSCTISWDSESETRGSATFEITDPVGECYIRAYLITLQNGVKEKFPLGTFLVQTPSSTFNGKVRSVSMDAYTPLIELKEKLPPIGYFIPKGESILAQASTLAEAPNSRAHIIKATSNHKLQDDYIAESSDTWLSYLSSLIQRAKHKFGVNELGYVSFVPIQDIETLQPIWTYDDGNSSILHPEITLNHDLYGIPNVLEIVYSDNKQSWHVIERNDDPESPTSIQRRGREIMHRISDPDWHDFLTDAPDGVDLDVYTQEQLKMLAKDKLKQLSTVDYTVSYTHGYCPVRIDDCVRLNYERAGLTGIKAKVVSQSINCVPGCPVSETAVFTTKLWR